jgi:hypothetical protein
VQYLIPTELSAGLLAEEEIAAIDPSLGPHLTIGMDLRTIYHQSRPDRPRVDNFLQMQGAVYLSFQLSARVVAYVSRGQSETGEVFGMAHVLPLDGYVRVGRFTQAYGWRFADHTQFTREVLGWVGPGRSDVGVECAVNPGRWSITGSIANGNRGSIADADEQAAYAGQVLYRSNLRGAGVGAGGSLWRNSNAAGTRLDLGPQGYVQAGAFTWMGEADWSTVDPPGAREERTSWVASQEASWRLRRGLDLRATYDFYDPDIDLKTGSRRRAGAGLEFFPYPYLAVHAMLRREEFQAGDGATAVEVDLPDVSWVEIQLHFLF